MNKPKLEDICYCLNNEIKTSLISVFLDTKPKSLKEIREEMSEMVSPDIWVPGITTLYLYLNRLEKIGVVEKEYPAGKYSKKKLKSNGNRWRREQTEFWFTDMGVECVRPLAMLSLYYADSRKNSMIRILGAGSKGTTRKTDSCTSRIRILQKLYERPSEWFIEAKISATLPALANRNLDNNLESLTKAGFIEQDSTTQNNEEDIYVLVKDPKKYLTVRYSKLISLLLNLNEKKVFSKKGKYKIFTRRDLEKELSRRKIHVKHTDINHRLKRLSDEGHLKTTIMNSKGQKRYEIISDDKTLRAALARFYRQTASELYLLDEFKIGGKLETFSALQLIDCFENKVCPEAARRYIKQMEQEGYVKKVKTRLNRHRISAQGIDLMEEFVLPFLRFYERKMSPKMPVEKYFEDEMQKSFMVERGLKLYGQVCNYHKKQPRSTRMKEIALTIHQYGPSSPKSITEATGIKNSLGNYLRRMLDSGIVSKEKTNNHAVYYLTPAGKKFVKSF